LIGVNFLRNMLLQRRVNLQLWLALFRRKCRNMIKKRKKTLLRERLYYILLFLYLRRKNDAAGMACIYVHTATVWFFWITCINYVVRELLALLIENCVLNDVLSRLLKVFILMRGVEFNNSLVLRCKTIFCFLFPMLFFSHFTVSQYWLPGKSILRQVSFSFSLAGKRGRRILPEVLFWFSFVLSHRFGLVSLFNKKAYTSGQAVFSKTYSSIKLVSNGSFKNIFLFKYFFLYFCTRGRALSTYWFCFTSSNGNIHNFMFRDVAFDERFGRLMGFAPIMWFDFNVIISLLTGTLSVLHLVFFLRDFLKIPLENVRLRERRLFLEPLKVVKFSKKRPLVR